MKPNQQNFPYKTGDSGYNRISGKKTLAFVGVCIFLVFCLTVVCFFLLFNSKSL